jgi:hypothetical protein
MLGDGADGGGDDADGSLLGTKTLSFELSLGILSVGLDGENAGASLKGSLKPPVGSLIPSVGRVFGT